MGEEEGWAVVEQREQEAGWSPAPPRLHSSNKPGPVKDKKEPTGKQIGRKKT